MKKLVVFILMLTFISVGTIVATPSSTIAVSTDEVARNKWYLTHDDNGKTLLENEGSSGASNSFNFYYTLRGGNSTRLAQT